jgi:hypothetical protein
MEEDEANKIATQYAKMLADEQNGSFTGDSNGMREAFSNRTGEMRLLADMALAIGPEKFASLPYGNYVFALNPTPTQLSAAALSQDRLNEYARERAVFTKALDAVKPKDAMDGDLDYPIAFANRPVKGDLIPLLEVELNPEIDGAWLTLNVLDSEGDFLSAVTFPLGNSYNIPKFLAARGAATAANKDKPGVKLSPMSLELAKRYMVGDRKAPLSSQAIDFLTHPEQHDPFNICFSEVMLGQAAQENRNLIATLGDSDLRVLRTSNDDVKPAVYEVTMSALGKVIYDRPDGWLIVHSKNPLLASETRLERAALGTFAQAYTEKGYESIEDWARLAAHVPPHGEIFVPYIYLSLLTGETSVATNDITTLHLYGLLSDEQRTRLVDNAGISFSSLTTEQQDVLKQLVYEQHAIRAASSAGTNPDHDPAPKLNALDYQPTESVPNGIPSASVLTAKTEEHPQILVTEAGMGVERPMEIDELANEMVTTQDAGVRATEDDGHILGIRYATRRTITFDLVMTDRVKMESTLTEDRYVKTNPVAPDQLKDILPEDLWNELQKNMDRIRADRKKFGNGAPAQVPTKTPPPSRSR